MNVGILGSGEVSQSLARGFLARGDAVMLGTREPEKLTGWRAQAKGDARVGSFADAAAFGELVALATFGMATEDVVRAVGEAAFAGKVVIDATNPVRDGAEGPELSVGFDDSLGERVQRALPSARVVKAFNTVGSSNFVQPSLPNGPPTMFVGGDDPAAKQIVAGILRDFGWEYADLGGISAARSLEPMCIVWVRYGMHTDVWDHAFRMLRPASAS